MSNSTSACEDQDGSSVPRIVAKKKRNLPGRPDPNAEVIALSPRSLLATNRFICEVCNKGFQRDQNLQLHRRGHNLPWKLKQKASHEVRKKVYICPELTCVHHDPIRALGDLTGIKKHFSRKHGEKKWKCNNCSKCYAVQSDWKAHQKTCGTREYRCDCGNAFSRRDSFITHRAFCSVLAEENGTISARMRQDKNQETPLPPSQDQRNAYMRSFGDETRALSSPTSQITRDAMAYSEVSQPPLNGRMTSDFDIRSQDGTALSKWRPCPAFEGSTVPSRQVHAGQKEELTAWTGMSPGLSLRLGTGPALPCSFQEMMTNMDASESLPFPSLHRIPFPQNYAITHAMQPSGAVPALFSSLEDDCRRRDSANGMLDALGYGNTTNELDMFVTQLHMSQCPSLPATSPSMMSRRENLPAGSHRHHATARSATALLQQAAQMGVTASKLQKFGMQMGLCAQEMPKQSWSWASLDSTMSSSSTSVPKQGPDFATHKAGFHGTIEHTSSSDVPDSKVIKGPLNDQNLLPMQASVPAPKAGLSSPSSSSMVPQHVRAGHEREHEGHAPMVDFLGVGESPAMAGLLSNCRKETGKQAF